MSVCAHAEFRQFLAARGRRERPMLRDRRAVDDAMRSVAEGGDGALSALERMRALRRQSVVVLSGAQAAALRSAVEGGGAVGAAALEFAEELLEDREDFNAEPLLPLAALFAARAADGDARALRAMVLLAQTSEYCARGVAAAVGCGGAAALLRGGCARAGVELVAAFARCGGLTAEARELLPAVLRVAAEERDEDVLALAMGAMGAALENGALHGMFLGSAEFAKVFTNGVNGGMCVGLKLELIRDLSYASGRAEEAIFGNGLFEFVCRCFAEGDSVVRCYCVDIFGIVSEIGTRYNDLLFESGCVLAMLGGLHEEPSIQLMLCVFYTVLTIFSNSEVRQQKVIMDSDFFDVFCEYFNNIPLNYLEVFALKMLDIVKKAELESNDKVLFYFCNNERLIEAFSDLISTEKKEPLMTYAISFISRIDSSD